MCATLETDKVEFAPLSNSPLGLMRFRLTYDGKLPSTNPRKKDVWRSAKWDIRKQISAQLIELYDLHPSLQKPPQFPVPGTLGIWGSSLFANPDGSIATQRDVVSDPIMVASYPCVPLVRDTLSVTCSLDVLFLRPEPIGRVVKHTGDIDNRIQLLFDALQMPTASDFAIGVPDEVPTNYLVQNDKLIDGVSIQTDRLLAWGNAQKTTHALLLIDVTVKVTRLNVYNLWFLGE